MTEEEYKKKLEHFETRVKRLQMYNEMLTIENQKLREENKELKGLPMYENDSRTGTDYEYNHALDELLQMRTKFNQELAPFKGKQIGKFGIIEDCFYEDTGIKVHIKDLGLIEFEIEDFFKQVQAD